MIVYAFCDYIYRDELIAFNRGTGRKCFYPLLGVAQVTDYVPTALAKVVETVKETTGFDLTDAMKANTIQAQTENNVNITTEKK